MNTIEELVEQMMAYKESLGYSRETYIWNLHNLANFIDENVDFDGTLKLSDIGPWSARRPNEGVRSYANRISNLREFTKYLYSMGLCDGIPSAIYIPVQHRRANPYVLTDDELIRIFEECDKVCPSKYNPLYQDIISVIFRLTYFCGLRPTEGRELLRNDVDLEHGTLLIRKNKSHKERMIPMADDVTEMCVHYARHRDVVFPDSTVFFPAPNGNPYSDQWLAAHFNQIWKTALPEKQGEYIRVYDLRHRFATTVMADALDRGENLYTLLPFLGKYMGHDCYKDTAYYIHLLPERLKSSPNFDYEQFARLYPEVTDYEEIDD